MYFSFYRRPTYVPKHSGFMGYDVYTQYDEKPAGCRYHMPAGLAFDDIIDGKTLPPASLADFMVYLLYVSRDAETLQFFLWLRNYTERFDKLAEHDAILSPAWQPTTKTMRMHNIASSKASSCSSLSKESFDTEHTISDKNSQAQPFRAEVDKIIEHYLLPGAPRELNLSYRVRDAVLHALEATTHPSAFKPCRDVVEQCLRKQAHPNFVRWALENGRRPRTIILRYLCAISFLAYLVGQVVLILSGQNRWLRISLSPVLFAGFLTLQAIFHGFCLLLYATRTRELRLWEMFASDEEVEAARKSALPLGIPLIPQMEPTNENLEKLSTFNSTISAITHHPNGILPDTKARLSPFGPHNDFEHEPWKDRWCRTPWYRKYSLTFTSCRTNLEEKAITAYQGRIVLQSVAIAMVLTVLVSAAMISVPEVSLL